MLKELDKLRSTDSHRLVLRWLHYQLLMPCPQRLLPRCSRSPPPATFQVWTVVTLSTLQAARTMKTLRPCIRPALLLDVVDASCLQLHVALHSRCHITVLIP